MSVDQKLQRLLWFVWHIEVMVKCLILCAGYGTRLQKGIQDDPSGKYLHLLGLPKPLVPLGGVPLITRWLAQLAEAGVQQSDVYLVCNQFYHDAFLKWAQDTGFPVENVINDGTTSNETRLGAVKDMELLVSQKNVAGELHMCLLSSDPCLNCRTISHHWR
jgi:NDP-sugar pyrophosphorylase family protein